MKSTYWTSWNRGWRLFFRIGFTFALAVSPACVLQQISDWARSTQHWGVFTCGTITYGVYGLLVMPVSVDWIARRIGVSVRDDNR